MMSNLLFWVRRFPVRTALLSVWFASELDVCANPLGGTVSQGQATISGQGTSVVNINQTSANAYINWQSFDVDQGETVNFNQPSSSSVTWNQINGVNPSQILGDINANGYVILQNPNGFVVGGQASINMHGLVMTTAATPALNFGGGGPWSFDTPPPAAKIVNYGQINIAGSGSAYLIANDIENNGTISAPGGKIGLYAGEQVLVSTSPDGRGLSAAVTIPQGMVDNNGNLIADGGSIALQAQMVNQDGLIQANSAQNVNGAIELAAGDSVNLGANSIISAQGDSQGVSAGGSVTIQSGNTFSDQNGSSINVSGGAQGGNGGQVEISAPAIGGINTSISGQAADGFSGGTLNIDPANIYLDSVNVTAPSGYSLVNVNSYSGMSQITITATGNIELASGFDWSLSPQTSTADLTLSAGNDITFLNGSGIQAGNNWTVNLTAGTAYSGTTPPASGGDGIYLDGNASLQTQNGNINLQAANEVQVGWSGSSAGAGNLNTGQGSINTQNGGNISVTAEFGDVNTGSSQSGFSKYTKTAPYDTVSSSLGGISTANGGNVNISAGGNVISFEAATVATPSGSGQGEGDPDPGTGCFGAAPGNVTINAGGNVYGCFVVMDGQGTINAQNIGTSADNVALSLATGGWDLTAQNSIYLQEVRNPNGLFNNTTASQLNTAPSAANHLFTYSPQAYVTLTAGNAVDITGFDLSRPDGAIPLLLPPIVNITAGPGGVVLNTPTATDGVSENDVTLSDYDITLFPSSYQSLDITTTGGGWLSSGNVNGTDATLLMSDSGYTQWSETASGFTPFGEDDHASVPPDLNNDNPVTINLNGSQLVNGVPVAAGMENLVFQSDQAAQINVAGDMLGCSFYGENLHPDDVTSITVGGQIYNAGSFTSIILAQGLPTLPAADTPLASELPQGASLSSWYLALSLALNPDVADETFSSQVTLSQLVAGYSAFPGLDLDNVTYNPDTKTLTVIGPLSSPSLAALESPTLTVVSFNSEGYPAVINGQLQTETINWASGANASLISTLYTESQSSVPLGPSDGAYVVGGTGQFDVTAGSISLGNSAGILSVGDDPDVPGGRDYSFLASYFTSAANINVTAGYLEMPASTIACLASAGSSGGNVTVTATGEIPNSPLNDNSVGVSMDLGSQELLNFESEIMGIKNLGLGIYTTGGGNVDVTAQGTIDIDSSRVATFDGGNVNVESLMGDVNAGSGGSVAIPIDYYAPDYVGNDVEYVPANGIVAGTLTGGPTTPPGAAVLPGNITVETPEGSIYASAAGILQAAYNEILSPADGSAAVTLTAGTVGPPFYLGNLDLGDSGVIGIDVNLSATGDIIGNIVAQQNANIAAIGTFSGLVFSIGHTTLNAEGGTDGPTTIIAVGGLNSSGNLSSANVFTTSENGGAGTLATTATASSASQSASNQTSTQAQQQIAGNSNDNGNNDKKKKSLLHVGRVTVLLSAAVAK